MSEKVRHVLDAADDLTNWGRFASKVTPEAARGGLGPRVELLRGILDRIELDLIVNDADHHIVTRTREHIARAPYPFHIVTVHLAGTSTLTLDGDYPRVDFGEGDVGYWPHDIPYRREFHGPFRILVVRVPDSVLDVAASDLAPLIGRRISSSTGFARMAVEFATDVLAHPELLAGPHGARIAGNVVALFTTMLVSELATTPQADRSAHAFMQVTEYIQSRLASPLDLAGIARDNHMSPRAIQALFHDRGTSVTEWIRQRRIEAARLMLADPAHAGLSLSEVAFRHGFADHAHFSRTFKAAFAETPSQWRTRAHRDGASEV